MDLTERRAFPLADALSATTGVLLSRARMNGLCALVEWMEREPTFPPRLYEPDMRRLLHATRGARTHLLAQHPLLAELTPPAGCDAPDLYAWLLEAERVHGETLTVSRPPPPAAVAAVDQAAAGIRDSFARMRDGLQSFAASIEAARRAVDAMVVGVSSEGD